MATRLRYNPISIPTLNPAQAIAASDQMGRAFKSLAGVGTGLEEAHGKIYEQGKQDNLGAAQIALNNLTNLDTFDANAAELTKDITGPIDRVALSDAIAQRRAALQAGRLSDIQYQGAKQKIDQTDANIAGRKLYDDFRARQSAAQAQQIALHDQVGEDTELLPTGINQIADRYTGRDNLLAELLETGADENTAANILKLYDAQYAGQDAKAKSTAESAKLTNELEKARISAAARVEAARIRANAMRRGKGSKKNYDDPRSGSYGQMIADVIGEMKDIGGDLISGETVEEVQELANSYRVNWRDLGLNRQPTNNEIYQALLGSTYHGEENAWFWIDDDGDVQEDQFRALLGNLMLGNETALTASQSQPATFPAGNQGATSAPQPRAVLPPTPRQGSEFNVGSGYNDILTPVENFTGAVGNTYDEFLRDLRGFGLPGPGVLGPTR